MLEKQAEWLTPAQAANRLGISGQRVRQLLDAGRLNHIRTPLGRLVDPRDVETFAQLRQERRTS